MEYAAVGNSWNEDTSFENWVWIRVMRISWRKKGDRYISIKGSERSTFRGERSNIITFKGRKGS